MEACVRKRGGEAYASAAAELAVESGEPVDVRAASGGYHRRLHGAGSQALHAQEEVNGDSRG